MHGLENILTHAREGEWQGEFLKSQFFHKKYELKLEFSETPMGGVWIFSEMIQCSCT